MDEGPGSVQPGPHRLQFTGSGADYFGIWIVNLLLSIVTLGIFSAWAKVRRLRYFYGNTLLDGSAFEFHGSPIALLKGRVIGVVLLVAYSQSSKVSVTLWLAVVAVLAVIFPWLIWKSLRFRLHNASYRGIRFRFTGSLRAVYTTFLPPLLMFVVIAGWGLLVQSRVQAGAPPPPALAAGFGLLMLAFFVAAPWFWVRVKRYQHAHAQLGSLAFGFTAGASGAYGIAFAALGLVLALGLAATALIALFGLFGGGATVAGTPAWRIVVGLIMIYAALLSVQPLVKAMAQNFVWRHTTLDSRPFGSDLRWGRLWWISAVNVLATVATLGLFWPFAVVRTLRYQVSGITWSGDPASALAGPTEAGTAAVGEEAADLLGFDVAL